MSIRANVSRTAKWGGLAATVAILVLMVGSSRCDLECVVVSAGVIAVKDGRFIVAGLPDASLSDWFAWPRWQRYEHRACLLWAFRWSRSATWQAICIPLWLPLGLIAGPTALLWWRYRRGGSCIQPGHCGACGYDLSGLAAYARCPECGTARSPAAGRPDAPACGREGRVKA